MGKENPTVSVRVETLLLMEHIDEYFKHIFSSIIHTSRIGVE